MFYREYLQGQCWDLLYINEFPATISFYIRLYADDVILCREIHSEEDILILQENLSTIACWAQDWLMYPSVNICKMKHPILILYKLNYQTLHQVTKTKYLGVTINQTLSWHDHIINICNKANATCGFLQRNLRNCSTQIKSCAYNTYVRPIIEYASVVWSPHTQDDISRIELVQRKAAHLIFQATPVSPPCYIN